MGNVKIAPVNRIEGHLDIEATTVGNLVTNVENQCVMFRGLENIMKKRDPRDAPIITSRV
jgi:Ni,Fe-hydrogenase I large subunit